MANLDILPGDFYHRSQRVIQLWLYYNLNFKCSIFKSVKIAITLPSELQVPKPANLTQMVTAATASHRKAESLRSSYLSRAKWFTTPSNFASGEKERRILDFLLVFFPFWRFRCGFSNDNFFFLLFPFQNGMCCKKCKPFLHNTKRRKFPVSPP